MTKLNEAARPGGPFLCVDLAHIMCLTVRMDEITRRAVRGIDEAISRHEAEIERLRRARHELRVTSSTQTTRREVPRATRARQSAGKGAITRVEEILARVGRTTQAEITKAAGKNSGTVSHALAALEADGKAHKTGRRVAGSPEWAHVAASKSPRAARRAA